MCLLFFSVFREIAERLCVDSQQVGQRQGKRGIRSRLFAAPPE